MYRTIANSSIAHTSGNVTYIMINYLKGLFPENFFHHVHITSRMAYREFMVQNSNNTEKYIKKNRPMLVCRPKVDFGNQDIFMSGSRHTATYMGTGYNRERGGFLPLFLDKERGISIKYLTNRLRVVMDCTIMLDTEYQQTNIWALILNMFHEEQVYWEKAAIECFVPKGMLEIVSDLIDMPIRDPESQSVRSFLTYLCAHSNKYWTFKEKNASQTEEFFVYYPLNIEMVFTGFTKNDMTKDQDVTRSADINFTLSAEFNTMGMFELSTTKDYSKEKANAVLKMEGNEGLQLIPFYTVKNLFENTDKDGYQLFFSNMFKLDPDIPRDVPDELDLDYIFKDTTLKDILEYHKKNGISNDILFNFILMKDDEVLNGDREKGKIGYLVDLDAHKILIFNKNYNATYRIVIYINNLYFTTLMNRLADLDKQYEEDHTPEKR